MIVGQHVRLSTVRCYQAIRPRWAGLGYASGLMLFLVMSTYGMIVAYSLPYIWNSCKDPLPWLDEGAESYWLNDILGTFPDLDNKPAGTGGLQGNLVLSLIMFYVIVFFTVAFGADTLAKITKVTVLLPVFILLILVLRTVFLKGAADGIIFYIGKFKSDALLDIRTWSHACSQIIFSLSPGFGTAITYSSYARPKEDVYKACMIVAVSNSLFSIIGGFAIFSMVGHLAYEQGVPVEEVATRSGTGLTFITMAGAMEYFGPFTNVMSVLFFSMLFLLGLDSAYAWVRTVFCCT